MQAVLHSVVARLQKNVSEQLGESD